MKKRMFSTKYIISLKVILLFIVLIMLLKPNASYAAFASFAKSPGIGIENNSPKGSKLDGITIHLQSSNGIKSYNINNGADITKKGKETVKAKAANGLKSDIYVKIPKAQLPAKDNEVKSLKISSTDSLGITTIKNLKVTAKKNAGKNTKYLVINSSPTLSDFAFANNTISYKVSDGQKIAKSEIYDVAAKSKKVYTAQNINNTTTTVSMPINKLSKYSNTESRVGYRAIIKTTDATNLETTTVISFEIPQTQKQEKKQEQTQSKKETTNKVEETSKVKLVNGFSSYVVAPSVSVDTPSKTKKEAIKVRIKVSNSTIKSYEIFKGSKRIDSGKPNVAEKLVTIPIKNLPAKGKTANYMIKATASNGENITKLVKITNKNGKYNVVTGAPSISDAQLKDDKITITAKGSKLNRIVVIDANTNKNVYAITNIKVDKKEISLDKSKIKKNEKDNYYRLKVYLYNQSGTYITKELAFIIPEKVVVIDNPEDTNSEPTVTDVTCKHAKIKYKTTENYHIKVCAECGANLGKEYHIFGGKHYKSALSVYNATGKCKICDYECKHTDVSYWKSSEYHHKICNTCGKEWSEEHILQNGVCTVCKASDENIGTMYYRDNDNSPNMLNRSPYIELSKSSTKLDDVKITVNDTPTTVKIYEVDAQGKNKKELKIEKSKESTSEDAVYILSHKKLLKGEKHHFYITAKNKYGTSTKYLIIRKKTKTENGKNIEYYSINSSPELSMDSEIIVLSNIGFYVNDSNGIKSIKVTDMNNNNKQVASYTAKNIISTSKTILLNVEKTCKAENGVYKLKVEMKDKSNTKKVSTRTVVIDTKTSGWNKYTTLYR